MKELRVSFDDDEFEKLQEAKKEMTWKEFILELIKGGGSRVVKNPKVR